MSKKKKRKKPTPKGWRASPRQVEAWLAKAERQIMQEQYQGAVQTARRLLRYVPEGSKPYGEAHYYLGTALGMLKEFEASYEALSEALEVQPEDASTWYNRALSARFLLRTGQALRDLEQALKLEKDPQSRKIYQDELTFMRDVVQKQVAARGPDATLDQLVPAPGGSVTRRDSKGERFQRNMDPLELKA
jgi:tetratricopeptide (TPR) repeat protein